MAEPTGIGDTRHFSHLVRAIAAQSDPSDQAYRVGHLREPSTDLTGRLGLPVDEIRLPRKVVAGAWVTATRPRADRWLGEPDLVHVLSRDTGAGAPVVVVTIHDLMPLDRPEWFGRLVSRWPFGPVGCHGAAAGSSPTRTRRRQQ